MFTSLEYRPYSTIPPNIISLVPSAIKPYAAQPGGISPRTAGTNHWFVAEKGNNDIKRKITNTSGSASVRGLENSIAKIWREDEAHRGRHVSCSYAAFVTCVIDVQLVHNSFISTTKDNH